MTKAQERKANLEKHYNALAKIAIICGVPSEKVNGKKLSIQILKLEKYIYAIEEKMCNIANFMTYDELENEEDAVMRDVQKLFNNNLKGLRVNRDPRGTSLKINDVEFSELYEQTGLFKDYGGDGLLCPDFS